MHTPAARRWAAILDQAERSTLSQRAFAREIGVNPNTLAWWKWRLGSTSVRSVQFTEVEVVEARAEGRLWLLLRDDVRVEVTRRTDLELLRDVVDALC